MSIPPSARRVVLASRPSGIPQAEHFRVEDVAVRPPGPGEFLVRNEFLSVEPAMRGWVNATANYSAAVGIGEVMRSFAAGRVIASRHPVYKEGDAVMGMLGWQEYALSDGQGIRRKIREDDLPLSLSLGVLGINGVTAWFSFSELAKSRPGDTVVVSTAAGGVGSAVGQIAKLAGCRTVGIAGGAAKCGQCLAEFGYDAAVDYKSPDFAQQLAQACPEGVDVYHDNTSGAISDAVMRLLNKNARVIVCGTASVANWDDWPVGPRVERHLLNKSASMHGFLIWDYEHRYEEAVSRLANWVRQGRLRYREDVVDGIERAPGSIADLYAGSNTGKRLIRLFKAA